MKKIEAIIQPYKLDEVHEALEEAGFNGLTVSEVKGAGRQKGQIAIYRGTEYNTEFIPKIRVELVCPDDKAEYAISTLINAAKTGATGDGKIFVYPIEQAIRVRTEEVGEHAL